MVKCGPGMPPLRLAVSPQGLLKAAIGLPCFVLVTHAASFLIRCQIACYSQTKLYLFMPLGLLCFLRLDAFPFSLPLPPPASSHLISILTILKHHPSSSLGHFSTCHPMNWAGGALWLSSGRWAERGAQHLIPGWVPRRCLVSACWVGKLIEWFQL